MRLLEEISGKLTAWAKFAIVVAVMGLAIVIVAGNNPAWSAIGVGLMAGAFTVTILWVSGA